MGWENSPFRYPLMWEDAAKRLSVRDALLDTEEFVLIAVFLRACGDISGFLKRAHGKGPYVERICEILKPPPSRKFEDHEDD